MCGIAGIVKLNPSVPVNAVAVAQNMCDTLRHRGPDVEGFLLFDGATVQAAYGQDTTEIVKHSRFPSSPRLALTAVDPERITLALGHRRLSILDIEAGGHQPMSYDEGNLWITFNGEIYNYIEIKNELLQLGHHFVTRSDTEVILAAYREWGISCVNKFNGMWAFVIFDRNARKIIASRDRFGVKPFYYYSDQRVFCFASEQKALVKQSCVHTGINNKAVFDYFVFGEIEQEEEGMFSNIMELFPSHNLELDLTTGYQRITQYYTLTAANQYQNFDADRYRSEEKKVAVLLERAVQLRMRADVAVGACLSGGLDSSAIACLMKKNSAGVLPLNFFTATFKGEKIDESAWAQKVVEQTGAAWYTVSPAADELANDLHALTYCQDVPIWSTSTYAQFRVMQLVKEKGIKVVLDGQGGDELFAGYPHHYFYYWNELKKYDRAALANEISASKPYGISYKQYLKFNYSRKLGKWLPNAWLKNLIEKRYPVLSYLEPELLEKFTERFQKKIGDASKNLNQKLQEEFVNTTLKTYLKCEDRCAMHHSVESRTPFADDVQLIEAIFALPSSYKIHQGTNKYILRKSLEATIPREISQRKDKMGYVTPHSKWMNKNKSFFLDVLNAGTDNWIMRDAIRRDKKFLDSTADAESRGTFKLVSFSLWKQTFFP
jgi:asparagine synthase (glutamine-hydrolysing)